ncbi:hypothetical protein LIER_19333 [Lithospermum erythrorhizon]|uniref:RNase H type-1 domain-containing protein n=1 Tax=Lithospermum erythrorhizon TaxID=34254 RepID=A0AAV3QHC2_LITER
MEHLPRERNKEADRLSQLATVEYGIIPDSTPAEWVAKEAFRTKEVMVLLQQDHVPEVVADLEAETLQLLVQRFHLEALAGQLLAQVLVEGRGRHAWPCLGKALVTEGRGRKDALLVVRLVSSMVEKGKKSFGRTSEKAGKICKEGNEEGLGCDLLNL